MGECSGLDHVWSGDYGRADAQGHCELEVPVLEMSNPSFHHRDTETQRARFFPRLCVSALKTGFLLIAILRAQAQACGHGQVDPHELLHDHRKRAFAKFTHADGGAVWVEADLPLIAATPELVDAMLGAFIEAAALARERAKARRGAA